MNIQAFVLALKLMAINIYAQILATATKFQFSTLYTTVYLTSARTMPSPRIQLFRRLNSRHTNNSAFSSSTPGPADKDPAHELMGLQVFMVVLTIFAIITIIVGRLCSGGGGESYWEWESLRRIWSTLEACGICKLKMLTSRSFWCK